MTMGVCQRPCTRRKLSYVSSARRPRAEAKQRAAQWPPRGPVRVLLVLDRHTVIEMIKLTLNHGVYTSRTASVVDAAAAVLAEWQPHLVIFDADLDGQQVM